MALIKKKLENIIGQQNLDIIITGPIPSIFALAQLSRISKLINYKKNIYKLYLKYFSKIKNVQITKKIQNTNQTFWIVYAICDKKLIKKIFESFQKYKIDMRPMFYTLSSMTPFKAYNKIILLSLIKYLITLLCFQTGII